MIVIGQAFRGFKVVTGGRPVANDSRAARLNDVADGAQRVTEVFCVVFLIATAKQRNQLTVEVHFFQRREEIIPVALGFTVVPGWNTQQQDVIAFQIFFAALGNVMHISNVFTELFLNVFAIFSVLPVSLPKKMPMIAMSKITS
jgi:hypothetical protein